jgi:hypothetical protein
MPPQIPVQLVGPEREGQAFVADQATGANRLGVGHLLRVIGGGRHRKEQVRVGGLARGGRPPLRPSDQLRQESATLYGRARFVASCYLRRAVRSSRETVGSLVGGSSLTCGRVSEHHMMLMI